MTAILSEQQIILKNFLCVLILNLDQCGKKKCQLNGIKCSQQCAVISRDQKENKKQPKNRNTGTSIKGKKKRQIINIRNKIKKEI